MRAIQAREAGGPDVLELVELPDPEPGPGQVLVTVAAAGVNFIDTYRRAGVYPVPFPHRLGSDGGGTVTAVGPGLAPGSWTVGDRVAWVSAPGSYADLVLVDADQLLAVPDDVPLDRAAAVVFQGLTAQYLVTASHRVAQGETVLVHAGAGGVGLLLTQLAAARGARVLATVSTEAKAELSRAAGADDVVLYSGLDDLTTELPEIVRGLTGGRGVDAVYDSVGKDTFDASLASLAPRGTLVLFGGSSGQVPPVDLQRLNAAGSVFVTRPKLDDHVATRAELEARAADVLGAVADGSLDVRIGATYALEDAAAAHRALESRGTTGKVLLLPSTA
ncbi:quinone oxidoreductase [Cellulomonas sp. PhB143]|uniref:quinone oxidoreductase family protein n=1 Tax=Cellulomonas sp. PhB143 TaxID=2485186 RepID=UPI000F4834A4|nr:quinone oxidoreductase [Cellulomonas sp. PhB143]ROS77254.1 NADPH2:quinone reductase [Cellulomonas sp. PhB143]